MSSNIIGTAGCGKTFDIKSVGEMCDEIKSIKAENKKASVALDQSYEVNALAQKTIEDLKINEKVREEKLQELTLMTKHLYDEQGARDCFNLVDQADLEELKAENKKLKEERDFFHEEVHKTLQHQADDSEQYEKEIKSLKDQVFHEHTKDEIKEIYRVSMELKEENKKLKAELEEKEEEVSLINSEEMENEEDIAKLKEENKKLKQKATAWDIVNNGTDWQDLRDLCDQQMCEALIKTGECDEEDFEGYDYGQLS